MSAVLEPLWQPAYSDVSLGLSGEAKSILTYLVKIAPRCSEPASKQKESIIQEFYKLTNQWKEETRYLSSIFQISMHPAYQQIIGMGSDVVWLILRELNQRPAHWFWALKAITRTDPVPVQYRGNVEKMIEYWLRWGKEQGYAF